MRALALFVLAGCCPQAAKPAAPTAEPTKPVAVLEHGKAPQPVQVTAIPEVDAKPDTPAGDAAKRDAELAAKAAVFVDAPTSSGGLLTPDGKRVVFNSQRDGLPQLYIADATKPASPATRILTTTERIAGAEITKDGKSLIYGTDVGADEHWTFHRVDLDGKNVVDLTPGERLNRDGWIIPDNKPDTMFFSARKMSEPKTTLYSASTVTAGPAKAIYSDELPAGLQDVSVDGTAALVLQFPSRAENYLLRVDIASGKAERIFPASGQLSIFDASFSKDKKLVYVATDNGTDQSTLLALDAKTNKVVAKHDLVPATAAINSVAVAPKGGLIAINLVLGSYAEIRLLDGKTLQQRGVAKLPLGTGAMTKWTSDGKRFTASWSTPMTPTSIYVVDAATGKATPLRSEKPLEGLPQIEATVVEIPAFDGGKIPANVYVAKGEAGKPHPTIVSYHGGPAGVSTVGWSAARAFWISQGYALVEPNVRGSSGYGRTFEAGDNGPKRVDAFKDIETSARWAAKQPFADKTRMIVYGGSYGGYTVLVALSRWPDIWRAGVNLFGLVNLKTFMATTSGLIRKIFLVEFGDPDKDAEFLAQISPLTDVDKIVDPTFVYAGANDPRVPRSESDLIVKALRQRKIPSEYMVAENEGHSLSRRETQLQFFARAARFLEVALR